MESVEVCMSIRLRDNCPCEECKHYGHTETSLHFCKKKQLSIVQHRGNAFHSAGTWIFPCGWGMRLFEEVHDEKP